MLLTQVANKEYFLETLFVDYSQLALLIDSRFN